MIDEISHNKILGFTLAVIVTLIGLVWGINNNRIGKLEDWRQVFEAHAEIPLTKQKIQTLDDEITRLESEVNKLRDRVVSLEKK